MWRWRGELVAEEQEPRLHFGEGGFDALDRYPMAHPVIAAGTQLMQALIRHALARR